MEFKPNPNIDPDVLEKLNKLEEKKDALPTDLSSTTAVVHERIRSNQKEINAFLSHWKDEWETNPQQTPANKILRIRIGYHENYFRRLVKAAGGTWNPTEKFGNCLTET